MPWRTVLLRGTRVLARCDEAGELSADGGRVEIRYRPGDSKAYRATPANLKVLADEPVLPDTHCGAAEAAAPSATGKKSRSAAAGGSREPVHPTGAIIAYTDGACSGNPGPAGLGVVLLLEGKRRELSQYLGEGTNNIAELAAIGAAAEGIEPGDAPIRLHTDSKYCIGLLTQGWKPKKNQELIAQVKRSLARHAHWTIHYVPGHSGILLNDRADALAVQAVQSRSSSGWVEY
jgi:ribonuclease HI